MQKQSTRTKAVDKKNQHEHNCGKGAKTILSIIFLSF